MQADKVELSWDEKKHNWLVRIEVGLEVINRHCDQPREANEETLRTLGQQTAIDEGYQFDPSRISIVR